MLAAVKGVIQGNTVIIEDDIREYDGAEVVVTLLDYPYKKEEKKVDLKKYMGRGEKLFHLDAQEMIKELRADERL